MILYVTNGLDIVTWDATQDTQISTVEKCVHMDILDWIAVKDVTDIAQTMNHVIMSVDCVKVDVRTGILEHIATAHATRVITAETVFLYVLLIVRRVNTQTERVLARRGGWVQAVQQNVFIHMERTVRFRVVCTVLTRHVTDLTEVACMVTLLLFILSIQRILHQHPFHGWLAS